ncbi:hypothetical protein Tco_0604882 [Tanacetum coccineum]
MEGDFYTDPRKTEGQKKVVTAVTIAPASVGGGVEAEVKGRASSVNQQSELHDDVESRKRGLEVVSSLSSELSSLKKAAAILTMISFQRNSLAVELQKEDMHINFSASGGRQRAKASSVFRQSGRYHHKN